MSGVRSLRRRDEFAKVYAEGFKHIGRLLVLYVLPAGDDADAVVASRKVGDAVRRNRAKRLLRAAITAMRGETSAATPRLLDALLAGGAGAQGAENGCAARPVWVVAVARAAIGSATAQDVMHDLERLAGRPCRSPLKGVP